jgi:hypothetical protein
VRLPADGLGDYLGLLLTLSAAHLRIWRVFPTNRLQITRRDRRICCSWVRLAYSAEKTAKDMADIAIVVLFISGCASLFGLGLFLFREQIMSRR